MYGHSALRIDAHTKQNCNAGFIVFPKHRGLKVGLALGRSYLHYGPRLGYRASVFNLVYANNKASLAIWDRLGFTRAGLIPEAGRLKSGPEGQEELVDAVVIYKRFDDIKE
jgi:ribosomal protein S18 acetylase RimI-like enzyme